MDLLQPEANLMVPWGFEPRFWRMYLDTQQRNPLVPAFIRTNPGDVSSFARWTGEFDYEAYYASAHYREYVKPQGQIDMILATLGKTASGLSGFSFVRHESAGYIGECRVPAHEADCAAFPEGHPHR